MMIVDTVQAATGSLVPALLAENDGQGPAFLRLIAEVASSRRSIAPAYGNVIGSAPGPCQAGTRAMSLLRDRDPGSRLPGTMAPVPGVVPGEEQPDVTTPGLWARRSPSAWHNTPASACAVVAPEERPCAAAGVAPCGPPRGPPRPRARRAGVHHDRWLRPPGPCPWRARRRAVAHPEAILRLLRDRLGRGRCGGRRGRWHE